MDLERWKEKYSFLKNVLGMFEKYENNVTVENGSIHTSCYSIWVGGVRYGSEYNEFCEKLIRNIWLIGNITDADITEDEAAQKYTLQAEDSNEVSNKYVKCSYLNKWIYYYIYIKQVSVDFIKEIFKITHNMLNVNPKSYKYYTENILGILNNDGHQDYSACLKYILECVAIYKKMKNDHCTNYDIRNEKYVKTCTELQNFKSTYDDKLSKVVHLRGKLPKLNDPLTEADQSILLEHEEYNAAQNGFLSGSLQRNLSTGAVAAAGTGALLLALNKFTPVGSWLRSGKRRTPGVENILQEGSSEESFLNDQNYLNMDSDSMGYNVGYASTENY